MEEIYKQNRTYVTNIMIERLYNSFTIYLIIADKSHNDCYLMSEKISKEQI